MLVAIRADASLEIGTGHVMRCLTLAQSLRDKGDSVYFVCREESGHLCDVVESRGFRCSRLSCLPVRPDSSSLNSAPLLDAFREADARQTGAAIESHGREPDLLVVDHYMLDRSWESVLRPKVGHIFVIDDLADRMHDCDLLLDQNLHDGPALRYSALVSESTRVFVGPEYALLRPEFCAVRAVPRTRGVRRILSFFGGVDSTNESLKIVQALRLIGSRAPQTDLVLGSTNPHAESVLNAAKDLACVNVLRQTADMAKLMREADLGLGTCGVAAWERCCVGLPSLVVVSADNQRDDARILHSMGAARNLGDASGISVEHWVESIRRLQDDPASLTAMSIAAASVMEGRREAVAKLDSAIASIARRR
jgi:UDP-2,4-diacetamido-2,4,6-trideoxy-beta-L-altropyranose hydrolase